MSSPQCPTPLRLLVVDDSATIRLQVRQALRNLECELLEASDGIEGLAVIESHPDLAVIICDVSMPRMDGLQMLEHLVTKNLTVPIVMLTTEGQPELIKRAKALGARGWMVKPVAPERLITVIKKLAHLVV